MFWLFRVPWDFLWIFRWFYLSNSNLGGSPLVSSLHAYHSSFAQFSCPHRILKASLLRLGTKLHRVQPPCETIQPPPFKYWILLGSCQVRFLENSQEVKLCSVIINFPQKGGLDTFCLGGAIPSSLKLYPKHNLLVLLTEPFISMILAALNSQALGEEESLSHI